jgi:hypothetical protein
MMLDILIGVITALLSINAVGIASENGYLNSTLSRGFAGVGGQITSSTFLIQYTNLETFLIACSRGYVGLSGYIFIGSLVLLSLVWINNIIEYRQAIM